MTLEVAGEPMEVTVAAVPHYGVEDRIVWCYSVEDTMSWAGYHDPDVALRKGREYAEKRGWVVTGERVVKAAR